MKQQIVHVHRLNQLVVPVMSYNPERTLRRRAAGHEKRIERSGKRTDVVGAGTRHVADFIHPDRAQPRKRNIGGLIPKLRAHHLLQILLHLRQALAAHQQRPHFRNADAAFAVDGPVKFARNAAPQIDRQAISRVQPHNPGPAGRSIGIKLGSCMEFSKTSMPNRFGFAGRGEACKYMS